MANGANGVLLVNVVRLVVGETERRQDVVITHHPKMKGKIALELPFNNKHATSSRKKTSLFFLVLLSSFHDFD